MDQAAPTPVYRDLLDRPAPDLGDTLDVGGRIGGGMDEGPATTGVTGLSLFSR